MPVSKEGHDYLLAPRKQPASTEQLPGQCHHSRISAQDLPRDGGCEAPALYGVPQEDESSCAGTASTPGSGGPYHGHCWSPQSGESKVSFPFLPQCATKRFVTMIANTVL